MDQTDRGKPMTTILGSSSSVFSSLLSTSVSSANSSSKHFDGASVGEKDRIVSREDRNVTQGRSFIWWNRFFEEEIRHDGWGNTFVGISFMLALSSDLFLGRSNRHCLHEPRESPGGNRRAPSWWWKYQHDNVQKISRTISGGNTTNTIATKHTVLAIRLNISRYRYSRREEGSKGSIASNEFCSHSVIKLHRFSHPSNLLPQLSALFGLTFIEALLYLWLFRNRRADNKHDPYLYNIAHLRRLWRK